MAVSWTNAKGEKKKGCFKCGGEGHMRTECPLNGGGDRKNGCYKCGELGHNKADCPSGIGSNFEMLIPGSKVGLIIGTGGEIIKRLMEETGAKLVILQETIEDENGEKRFVKTDEKSLRITGSQDKIQHAVEKVMEILNQFGQNDDRVGGSRGGGRGGHNGVGKGGSGKPRNGGGGDVKTTKAPTLNAEQEELLTKTKKNARSVLLPNKEGLLSDEFEKEFKGHFGFPVPYKRLGFISTMELIEYKMTDVIDVERMPTGHILLKGIPDKNTDHITRMVKNQRQNQEGYNRRTAQLIHQQGQGFRRQLDKSMVTDAARVVPNHTKTIVEDLMVEHDDGLAVANFCRAFHEKEGYRLEFTSWGFLNLKDFLYYGLGDMLDLTPVDGHYGIEWLIFPKQQSTKTRPENPAENLITNDQSKEKMWVSDLVPGKMKAEFESILKIHVQGITAEKFAEEYEKLYGCELAPQQFGCQSVVEMCLWLPDIFEIHRDGAAWTFKGRPNEFLKEEKRIVSVAQKMISVDPLEKCNLTVTEHIKSNVKRVLMKHPDGLAYHKFRRAYLDTIGNNLGVKSLESFFMCPGIDHLIQLKKESDKVVIMPTLEITKNNCIKRKDVIVSRSELIQQELPSDRRVGDFIEVIVNEVGSPQRFWIRLNGNTNQAMDQLMDQMDTFYYSSKSTEYRMPACHVTAGLLCATLFMDGTWHRAQVKEVIDESHVEVFFVDYGTNAKVRIDTLRYLHKNFGELPAQAIQARLAGVKPVGGMARFSKEATSRFLELMKSSPEGGRHVAAIADLKPKLILWLMDTHYVKGGLPVSQILVEEGLVEVDVQTMGQQVKLVETTKLNHISKLLNEP